MLQINQNEFIPITRNLEDSTDSGTNYVQASIYKFKGNNAGVLLTTLNLTDRGNQKFETAFQAPSDADDYFLEIIIKVFTDSGYTLENARYERTQEKYLVATRWGMMYRGGGGAGVNYDLIKKIIRQEIEKVPKPVQEKINFNPVLNAIGKIEIPEPTEIDLNPLLEAIRNVKEEIGAIKIPKPEKLNLTPVLVALDNLGKTLPQTIESIMTGLNQKDAFQTLIGSFEKEIGNTITKQFKDKMINDTVAKIQDEMKKSCERFIDEIKNVSFITLKTTPEKKELVKQRQFV